MARTVRDAKLGSRNARLKLAPRGQPYWRELERAKLHLGFRRLKGKNGTWWARLYQGGGRYAVDALGSADDYSDADGLVVLSFDQAAAKARERMVERAKAAAGQSTAAMPTVREAVETYVAARDKRDSARAGREVRSDAHTRLSRYVLSADIASVALDELEKQALKGWRAALPDTLRRTTVQRLVNDFRAALNGAYEEHETRLAAAFPATVRAGLCPPVDDEGDPEPVARDNQILSDAQVGRLIAAARDVDAEQGWDGDLCRVVIMLAATGARFSQVARLKVGDVQRANGRVLMPVSRKGRGKKVASFTPVPLGRDVLDALLPATTGRAADEPLLERWRHKQVAGDGLLRWQRASRGPWSSAAELTRLWDEIRERAGIPAAIPYGLRHSSIVRGLRANLSITHVAKMHDTSASMIETHYGRWIAEGLEELAARAVVPLVPNGTDNVVTISRS